jgi:ComF family protein
LKVLFTLYANVSVVTWLKDFISLIYPHQCVSCDKTMYNLKNCICVSCQYKLPKTNFHLEKDNIVAKIFWGKVDIYRAMSFCFFEKDGRVQSLVHALKYKGNSAVGVEVGEIYGVDLKQSGILLDVEYIIPVPLHAKKMKTRGYNQAESFGIGLAKGMEIECLPNVLVRKKHTETQTKKSQFERWLNVDSVFDVEDYEKLKGKHVLLVDDVVTTGSTLEACTHSLLQVQNIKVSIATIAYAQ